MCRRNIYEIYEGDELIVKGTHMDFYNKFQIGEWALKTHSRNHTLFKNRYTVICIGKEPKKEKKKPQKEETFDYMPYQLKVYGNTIVSKKEFPKNIDRLQEMFNNRIKVTKVEDYDFGDGGKWKKDGYHYLLEII